MCSFSARYRVNFAKICIWLELILGFSVRVKIRVRIRVTVLCV